VTRDYPRSENDEQRLEFVAAMGILDTSPDVNLDRITGLCRDIFDVPICVVTIVAEERQWFKSVQGLDVCETTRDVAFCNFTILDDDIFEVVDATVDPRFADNPLVTGEPHIRYYAGAPVIYDGNRLGSLCLIDSSPRAPLDERQRRVLESLAAMVVREIRLQRLLRLGLAALTQQVVSPELD
jgi:GAF domain-containing protein